MNRVVGKRWKQLSEEEKQLFINQAIKYRKKFKKEIQQTPGNLELAEWVDRIEKTVQNLKKE